MALAADGQRERTVGLLRRAYLEGRLDSDEFTERAGRALEARTTGELRALVRDLPWLEEVLRGAKAVAVRAAVLAALGFSWLVASLVLFVAFVAGLFPGGMSATESLVFPLLWLLFTWAVWRAARR